MFVYHYCGPYLFFPKSAFLILISPKYSRFKCVEFNRINCVGWVDTMANRRKSTKQGKNGDSRLQIDFLGKIHLSKKIEKLWSHKWRFLVSVAGISIAILILFFHNKIVTSPIAWAMKRFMEVPKQIEEKAISQQQARVESQGAEGLYDGNFWISFVRVWMKIGNNVNINTHRPARNNKRACLYEDIQRILSTIGFYDGEIDGKKESTYPAVKLFQEKSNIDDDGVVGPKTWNAILDKLEGVMEKPGSLSIFRL